MHRVARAVLTVVSSSLLTFGALFAATVDDADAAATSPVIAPDPQMARILRKDEKPHASRREQQGIFVPPQESFEPPPMACEPGEEKPCFPPGMGPSPFGNGGPHMHCELFSDGSYHWQRSSCNTPLVMSFDANASISFTKPEGPSRTDVASFPIGLSQTTEWVSASTPWLALDADGSGCIEGQAELFGGSANDANGFDKLARLDENHDGVIDAKDPAFSKLVLWADRDQDKQCKPSELTPVADAGLVAIDLHYTSVMPPRFGSFEGERATFVFRDTKSGAEQRGRVVDVYLAPR